MGQYKKWTLGHVAPETQRMIKNSVSPLALACLKGYENAVKVLLSQGADVNLFSTRGNTAAMIAFTFGHFEIVKLLMYASGFNYFARNRFGVPFPVLIASNFDLFKIFLENNLNNPEIQQIYCQLLYACCRNNNIEAVKVLLSSKVVPEQQRRVDPYMAHYLILNGNVESVKFISELSTSTASVDYSNLHFPAAEIGLIEYFQVFPAKLSNYPIVLRAALRKCHHKLLTHLQCAKPDVFDEYLIEALRAVTRHAVPNNIEFLFNLAMKKFPTDDQIFTNLALSSIKQNQFEMFKTISSLKVSKTALVDFATSAAKFNRMNVLKLILSKNPKVPLKNALSCSVLKGHTEIVKFLLSMSETSPQDQDVILFESLESKDKNCTVLLLESDFKPANSKEFLTKAANTMSAEKFHVFIQVYLKKFPNEKKSFDKSKCLIQ